MYTTDDLMNDCWMRDLDFADFVRYAIRHDVPLCTEQEYVAYCIQRDAEMTADFEAMMA